MRCQMAEMFPDRQTLQSEWSYMSSYISIWMDLYEFRSLQALAQGPHEKIILYSCIILLLSIANFQSF